MGTRARIWFTMILLGYPFLAIGASTCSFAAGKSVPPLPVLTTDSHAIGLLLAASYSEASLIKYGGYVVLASSIACGFVVMRILGIMKNARRDGSADGEKV